MAVERGSIFGSASSATPYKNGLLIFLDYRFILILFNLIFGLEQGFVGPINISLMFS
jgi:hypothetical protein